MESHEAFRNLSAGEIARSLLDVREQALAVRHGQTTSIDFDSAARIAENLEALIGRVSDRYIDIVRLPFRDVNLRLEMLGSLAAELLQIKEYLARINNRPDEDASSERHDLCLYCDWAFKRVTRYRRLGMDPGIEIGKNCGLHNHSQTVSDNQWPHRHLLPTCHRFNPRLSKYCGQIPRRLHFL